MWNDNKTLRYMSFLKEYCNDVPDDILKISHIVRYKDKNQVKKEREYINKTMEKHKKCYGFDEKILSVEKMGASKHRDPEKDIVYIVRTKKSKYIFKKLLVSEWTRLDYVQEIYFDKLFNGLKLHKFGFYIPKKREVFIPNLGLGVLCEFVPNLEGNRKSALCSVIDKRQKCIIDIVDYLIHNNDRWSNSRHDHISLLTDVKNNKNNKICLIDNSANHYHTDNAKTPNVSYAGKKFMKYLKNLDLKMFDGIYKERLSIKYKNILLECGI